MAEYRTCEPREMLRRLRIRPSVRAKAAAGARRNIPSNAPLSGHPVATSAEEADENGTA